LNIGQRLVELQRLKGVKCIELARSVGVSKSQVTRWRQASDIKVTTLVSICEALGVNIGEFLTEKSPRNGGKSLGGVSI